MKRLLFAIGFMFILMGFFGGVALSADNAVLTWTNTATWADDNTAIPAGFLVDSFVRIYEGDTAEGPWTRTPDVNFVVGYPTNTAEILATAGKWYTATFVIKIDPNAPMTNTNKNESPFAEPVQYLATAPPTPPPPGPGKSASAPGHLKIEKKQP